MASKYSPRHGDEGYIDDDGITAYQRGYDEGGECANLTGADLLGLKMKSAT